MCVARGRVQYSETEVAELLVMRALGSTVHTTSSPPAELLPASHHQHSWDEWRPRRI